ncbi:hypothetical protein CMV_020184 [Castanea mollissima]|uniref:Uncharacterized protein n=1 Tax=Castanea mollissima TaxID=60419 RepID=A0A8J4QZ14_9ROSI|nr:hypothetical protein CMV_020184 [Castanea mollissima]
MNQSKFKAPPKAQDTTSFVVQTIVKLNNADTTNQTHNWPKLMTHKTKAPKPSLGSTSPPQSMALRFGGRNLVGIFVLSLVVDVGEANLWLDVPNGRGMVEVWVYLTTRNVISI